MFEIYCTKCDSIIGNVSKPEVVTDEDKANLTELYKRTTRCDSNHVDEIPNGEEVIVVGSIELREVADEEVGE